MNIKMPSALIVALLSRGEELVFIYNDIVTYQIEISIESKDVIFNVKTF